ncbi:unnamed protein product [Pleuronectes platessa]|uniref:Uncharacterized protein n=1 Tax=Pleuronectes platessa TaxID=8262 RepID=A0A9N7UJS7_PLEPL|nr:unnamed protein product [Pleuronectes platessa]
MPSARQPHATSVAILRQQYAKQRDLCLARPRESHDGAAAHWKWKSLPAHQPVPPAPRPLTSVSPSLTISLLMPAGTLGAVPLQSLYPPPPRYSTSLTLTPPHLHHHHHHHLPSSSPFLPPPPPLDASRRPSQCGTPSAAARPGNPSTPPLLANSSLPSPTPPPLQTAATHNPPLPRPRGAQNRRLSHRSLHPLMPPPERRKLRKGSPLHRAA